MLARAPSSPWVLLNKCISLAALGSVRPGHCLFRFGESCRAAKCMNWCLVQVKSSSMTIDVSDMKNTYLLALKLVALSLIVESTYESQWKSASKPCS